VRGSEPASRLLFAELSRCRDCSSDARGGTRASLSFDMYTLLDRVDLNEAAARFGLRGKWQVAQRESETTQVASAQSRQADQR